VASANVDLTEVGDIEAFSLEDLLEKPVVSASRYAQKPASTPIVVSSVDVDQIDALGYRTLGEALRSMRGVYLTNDRNYSYLGARGFAVPGDYNTRFALAIDGHRMNDAVYGQALLGLEAGLPLIAVDRVELVRGGAWSVYGQNALLGAINVVTATGKSRPGLHVRATSNATLRAGRSTARSGSSPPAPWRSPGLWLETSSGSCVRGNSRASASRSSAPTPPPWDAATTRRVGAGAMAAPPGRSGGGPSPLTAPASRWASRLRRAPG
jgi:hypothetical protein